MKPTILNRNFLDWILLLLGVANILIGIWMPFHPWIFFNFFVAGMCLEGFIVAGIINRYSKLVSRANEVAGKTLAMLKRRNNEHRTRI